ncbi:hypothetical protein D3C74_318570 [compost metagenome]
MVRTIQVSAFLKQLGEGISAPSIILSDDNQRYILKNQKTSIDGRTIDLNCSFLNELLSHQIAEYLGAPVPEAAVAELDRRILDNGPALRFVHRFTEGIYFASYEVPEKEDNLLENYQVLKGMGKPYISRNWNKFYSNICNPKDSATIIALDIFIANLDRYNNTGNLIIAQSNDGRKLFSIDHGHAFFGPVWQVNKMSMLKSVAPTDEYFNAYLKEIFDNQQKGFLNGLGEVFKSIETNINLDNNADHDFIEIVHKIEQINEDLLDSWFSNIPDIWFVDKVNQIGIYKYFLMQQKYLVRDFIQILANYRAFTNFRGGKLQWKEKLAGTV